MKTELAERIKKLQKEIRDSVTSFEDDTGLRVREDGIKLNRTGLTDNPPDAIWWVTVLFSIKSR